MCTVGREGRWGSARTFTESSGHVHPGSGTPGLEETAVVPCEFANMSLVASDFLHLRLSPQRMTAQLTYLPWGLKRWWN